MFVLMLMIGGIAIDVMRFENTRTIMQNCMDRGSLAAADLDQTMDARSVAEDYLQKCGLTDESYSVAVDEDTIGDTMVGRRVMTTAEVQMNTFFMHLLGIDRLPVTAGSAAEEGINDIEIAMVLDVSGSMRSNSKLENMQDAAKEFIDTIFDQSVDGRVSLSLVPYSTQVNIGEDLFSTLTTQHDHDYSYCIDFQSDDFDRTRIDPVNDTLQQAGHFDPWTRYGSGPLPRNFVCRTEDAFQMTPWSRDVDGLKDQIDDLTAKGNTSIDIAMKWGAALLDPAMQPALADLTGGADPVVDPGFVGRPASFANEKSIKFIVVMTDGINTTQYYLNDGYRRGPSGIWYDPDSRRLSQPDVEIGDTDLDGIFGETWWWARYADPLFGRRWGAEVADLDDDMDGRPAGPYDTIDVDDDPIEVAWPQLWAYMTPSHRAYEFVYRKYFNATDYSNAYYAPFSWVNASEKDARLARICSAAKDQGIIVFSVGFEVTDYSAGVMRNCASSPSHFYRVEGLDITTAFASIANQINQLKLTQ